MAIYKTVKVKLELEDGVEEYTMFPPTGKYLKTAYRIAQDVMKNQEAIKKAQESEDNAMLPFSSEIVEDIHSAVLHCLEKRHIRGREDKEELSYVVSQYLIEFLSGFLEVSGLSRK